MIYKLIASGKNVYLRRLERSDESIYLDFVHKNETLHNPWVSPAKNREDFISYLKRTEDDRFDSLAAFNKADNNLIGVFHLSEIVMGAFCSCYLSYFGSLEFARLGYMSDALQTLLAYIFKTKGLHRLEANIRPENLKSINFVIKNGFIKEGFSCNYLFLNGAWRDHERWAIYEEIWDKYKIDN